MATITNATIRADTIRPSDGTVSDATVSNNAAIQRAKLEQNTFAPFGVPFTALRVADDLTSLLPGTASGDDLAIIEGTFGTDAAVLQTEDSQSTSVTQRARFLFSLPVEYDDSETIQVRVRAAMNTTVSDDSATVDVEAYKHDDDGSVGSDLVTTSAQSINALTHDDKDFTITSSGLASGDVLDIRVTVDITDSATGTAVIGEITKLAMLLDVRG